jgi:hypothetical protein
VVHGGVETKIKMTIDIARVNTNIPRHASANIILEGTTGVGISICVKGIHNKASAIECPGRIGGVTLLCIIRSVIFNPSCEGRFVRRGVQVKPTGVVVVSTAAASDQDFGPDFCRYLGRQSTSGAEYHEEGNSQEDKRDDTSTRAFVVPIPRTRSSR